MCYDALTSPPHLTHARPIVDKLVNVSDRHVNGLRCFWAYTLNLARVMAPKRHFISGVCKMVQTHPTKWIR